MCDVFIYGLLELMRYNTRGSVLEQRQSAAEHPAGLGASPGRPGQLLPEAARDGDLAPGHRHRHPPHGHRDRRLRGHSLPQHRQVRDGFMSKKAILAFTSPSFGVNFTYGQYSVVSLLYFTFTIHRSQYHHH